MLYNYERCRTDTKMRATQTRLTFWMSANPRLWVSRLWQVIASHIISTTYTFKRKRTKSNYQINHVFKSHFKIPFVINWVGLTMTNRSYLYIERREQSSWRNHTAHSFYFYISWVIQISLTMLTQKSYLSLCYHLLHRDSLKFYWCLTDIIIFIQIKVITKEERV